MAQLGRNDLCHCGSGKKYKKCCLDQDQQTERNATGHDQQLKGDSSPEDMAAYAESSERLTNLIHKLDWPSNAQYELTEELFKKLYAEYDMKSRIVRSCLVGTLMIWNDFCKIKKPAFRKAGGYKAAIEYFFVTDFGGFSTQSELAAKHKVSVSSLSTNLRKLEDFFEEYVGQLSQGSSDMQAEHTGLLAYSDLEHEAMLANIQRLVESQELNSPEELEKFLAKQLNNPEAFKIRSPESNEDKAYELLMKAEKESSSAKQIKLVQQALKLDPNNSDALLLLAQLSTDISEAIKLSESAMNFAQKELGEPFFKENKGYFWGLSETRLYMRATNLHADLLYTSGRISAACEQYEVLLELNPNDNQGIRYSLLKCYLELERLDQAERIFKSYENEISTEFQYNQLVLEYLKSGYSARLPLLYKRARKQNQHVLAFLLGKKSMPATRPDYMTPGDQNDAVNYFSTHEALWYKLYGLTEWISKQKQ
ncbi:tetratricopeptide repeat protein [Paenibacillus terrae]|uniref:Tetratricopeptide repeat protein n=1 Tax=Paenibacillus terrae (strain HPL-003) TaxID=985665 RepID=G7W4T7_PAETH|nr:tetratricopeptide repeat protein [Paenibacillus terrae]AET60487.1 hypothetical protein HPL003_18725 [Paenibacillus terrae HPL-003]